MRDPRTGTPGTGTPGGELSRRGFLRGATATALLATAGSTLLSACGSTGPAQQASSASQVTLPSYYPQATGITPDLPGTALGVPDAFYNSPAAPVAAFSSPPLSGGTISGITTIFNSPPPGAGSNPAWQEVQKRLGATVNINMVVADDYDTKLSTVIAGGNMPDLMLYDGTGMTDVPQFLEAECADLGPLLGGDKIKDYPHLAAIPKIFWEQCTANGELYFLPIPRSVSAGSGFYHQEMLAAAGVSSTQQIRDSGDFLGLLKDLTSPSQGRYALAGATTNGGYSAIIFHHVFGTPNVWRADGAGKLTNAYETDEYKAAVAFMVQVYKAGCYYPGSQGWTKTQMENAFQAGKAAFIYDGLPGFGTAATTIQKIDPAFRPMPIVPFGHAGGKGITWQDNVIYARTMLKKGSTAHLQDVLKACDFFAAPFGTEEYLLMHYGVAGRDYSLDANHNPVLTTQGNNDTQVPWKYLAAPQNVLYTPGADAVTKVTYEAYADIVPMAVANPCAALFSPTDGTKGAALDQAFSDAVGQVISGQAPMSAFDSAVTAWQNGGGNQIRTEYEQAYAHAGTK